MVSGNREYLFDYVRESIYKGHSSWAIKSVLISRGYSPKEVEEAISHYKGSETSAGLSSAKKAFLTVGLLTVLIVSVLLLFVDFSKTISEEDLSHGVNFNLGENKARGFVVDDEKHTILVESVSEDSVELVIQSDPIKVIIRIGEEKKLDLDNDGFYDLLVRLDKIENGVPDLHIGRIQEEIMGLNIRIPKPNYGLGEEFSGESFIDYSSEPFEAVVLHKYSREDFSEVRYTISRGILGESPGISLPKLTAFRLNDTEFVGPVDYFYEEGVYIYAISVYSCSDIEDILSVRCDEADVEDIDKNVDPLKTSEERVVVSGGEDSLECVSSEECMISCEGCSNGTQICEQTSGNCVDCFLNSQCLEEYSCEDNICVLKEDSQDEIEEELVTYPVTNPDTILDCYSEDLLEILCSPEDALEFTNLFESRLGSCEVSEGTFALGFEPIIGIFRGYEIQEEQGSECFVKFWFLENSVIDPDLLNKDMVCTYDSSKRTTQDVNDCFEECCSGELFDATNEAS